MEQKTNSFVNRNKLVFLKVKIKSLAAEAKIIRNEEHKSRFSWKHDQTGPYIELKTHRRYNVRWAARSSLLAYAFLRGKSYKQIEPKTHEAPNIRSVADNVLRFSDLYKIDEAKELVEKWIKE